MAFFSVKSTSRKINMEKGQGFLLSLALRLFYALITLLSYSKECRGKTSLLLDALNDDALA